MDLPRLPRLPHLPHLVHRLDPVALAVQLSLEDLAVQWDLLGRTDQKIHFRYPPVPLGLTDPLDLELLLDLLGLLGLELLLIPLDLVDRWVQ